MLICCNLRQLKDFIIREEVLFNKMEALEKNTPIKEQLKNSCITIINAKIKSPEGRLRKKEK